MAFPFTLPLENVLIAGHRPWARAVICGSREGRLGRCLSAVSLPTKYPTRTLPFFDRVVGAIVRI
jgi:hypothetical protein